MGTSLLVGLMLLSSGLLPAVLVSYGYVTDSRNVPDIYIYAPLYFVDSHRVAHNYGNGYISEESVAQLKSLDNVSSVKFHRSMAVNAILDKVPRYAIGNSPLAATGGMLDEEGFAESLALYPNIGDPDVIRQGWEEDQERYLQFLNEQGITGEAFPMTIQTFDPEDVEKFADVLDSGAIHLDAINAGREVIVCAPEIYVKATENSYRTWYSEYAVKSDPFAADAVKASWNDAFTPGQTLPLVQLYSMKDDDPTQRRDASVSVGAVVHFNPIDETNLPENDVTILTTEQGLANIGLYRSGIHKVDVWMDSDTTIEEEEVLEKQITAISRRTINSDVYNRAASLRERRQETQQQILLFVALALLFFTVSVGMIVSSVTRQLNSAGRTIGMLRAVGADEKAILGCYSGQITASVAGGMIISIGLFLVIFVIYLTDALHWGGLRGSDIEMFLSIFAIICVMAPVCYLVCRFFLRFRVREIVNKSIIENIREL